MIATWMGYCIVVTAALALVAAMTERIAAVRGWPRRGIWIGAIAASVALVSLSPTRAPTPAPAVSQREALRIAASMTAGIGTFAAPASERRDLPPLVRWRAIAERLQVPLMAIWLIGSLGVSGLFLYAAWAMARRRRSWRPAVVDGKSLLLAERDGPALAGLFRPRIVLPTWALSLDRESRGLMLAHELEHLRARDPLLTHTAGLALLVLPWNLPLWWMLRRLRLAVEVDCDARVLGVSGVPPRTPAPHARAYGELLLEVATRRSRRLAAAPALLEHTTALGRRIVAMHPRLPRYPRAHTAVLAAGALALSVFAGYETPPGLALPQMIRPAGWVFASDLHGALAVDPAHPEVILATLFPTLLRVRGPTIASLVLTSRGGFSHAVLGAGALGPVRERLAPDAGSAIERLAQADDSLGWHGADQALFEGLPSGPGVRAVSLRASPTADVTTIELRRLPAGHIGPGVVYLFVLTLKEEDARR